MADAVRIAQFLELDNGPKSTSYPFTHRYQNYFVSEVKSFEGQNYAFLPFQVNGTSASLNGDNSQVQILMPYTELGIRLVELGDGNRLSRLTLSHAWYTSIGNVYSYYKEYYVGIGASYSDTTIELRFRSAADSVNGTFPARTLTRDNVGILPLNADLYLQ
jgi:hypothetical protein